MPCQRRTKGRWEMVSARRAIMRLVFHPRKTARARGLLTRSVAPSRLFRADAREMPPRALAVSHARVSGARERSTLRDGLRLVRGCAIRLAQFQMDRFERPEKGRAVAFIDVAEQRRERALSVGVDTSG